MRKKIILSVTTTALLLAVAIGAWASANAARTDVQIPIQPGGAAAVAERNSPPPLDTVISVRPEHSAAVHPYVETPDTEDTKTLRVQSQ